jgi:hypothetical protein
MTSTLVLVNFLNFLHTKFLISIKDICLIITIFVLSKLNTHDFSIRDYPWSCGGFFSSK